MKAISSGMRVICESLEGGCRRAIRLGHAAIILACASMAHAAGGPEPEVRGTWLTTTANSAIATPENSARSMQRLREIGLNTVYVEVWKNGYTQFPSKVLERTIGLDRRPGLMPQDPADTPETLKRPARDLLEETLIEAHRNGLVYVAWFEYGFMAAHKSTDTHLRRMKKDWLSLDKDGNEVAPNGFVWMNPLHPETRRFLLDLVLEAIDRYDLDGVQLDDRIVWPYVTMGYDAFTKKVYAQEHGGKEPPLDHTDPEWVRWRADKVNEYARQFVAEVRAKRPSVLISLSPAVYPWCYEHYCLEWPKWAAWDRAGADPAARVGGWDEFIPQVYRMNYPAFEKTWNDQVNWMNTLGGGRVRDMLAGIRVVGDGPDSTWADLRSSMELVRKTGGGGHVHWFSRGVLDLYPAELSAYYDVAGKGRAANPRFPAGWRPLPIVLSAADGAEGATARVFAAARPADGRYRLIARRGGTWSTAGTLTLNGGAAPVLDGDRATIVASLDGDRLVVTTRPGADAVELLVDRRP